MDEFIEKLIGRLEELKIGVMLNNKCCKHIIDKIIEIVNELAEEYHLKNSEKSRDSHEINENGWIPATERLPDFLDNVLVCTKSGGRTIAHLKHTPIEWRDVYMNKIDDVIAWKYLDTPYQPKGE